MNCLILAAGHGSRLRSLSDSKPLTPVAGKPLIEHVIAGAVQAGARNFTIVTGHRAEQVEAFVAALASRLGVAAACVRSIDWDRPNGHSVLAGAAEIDGPYLLLMADHLFEPQIPRRLIAHAHPEAGVTLAIDRDLASPFLDMEDATKVEVGKSGEILRIGKDLTHFDAIDTGIFLATPALAEAIRADISAGGGGSLSEAVQRLADQGRASTMEVAGARWIDVDDPRALGLAERLTQSGPDELRDNAA